MQVNIKLKFDSGASERTVEKVREICKKAREICFETSHKARHAGELIDCEIEADPEKKVAMLLLKEVIG